MASVVQWAYEALPAPREECTLDEILAFRVDSRERGVLDDVRQWMVKMSSIARTEEQLFADLGDHLEAYIHALLAERTERDSVMESLVISTAEFAESMVTFRWKHLATRLVERRRRRIELADAESTLPGRELAYIVRARERFGDPL